MSSQIINQAGENKPLTQVYRTSPTITPSNKSDDFLGVLQFLQGSRLQPLQRSGSRMGALRHPCQHPFPGIRYFFSVHELEPGADVSPLVNTDQTAHMDPDLRAYQAANIPLKRFAEV